MTIRTGRRAQVLLKEPICRHASLTHLRKQQAILVQLDASLASVQLGSRSSSLFFFKRPIRVLHLVLMVTNREQIVCGILSCRWNPKMSIDRSAKLQSSLRLRTVAAWKVWLTLSTHRKPQFSTCWHLRCRSVLATRRSTRGLRIHFGSRTGFRASSPFL